MPRWCEGRTAQRGGLRQGGTGAAGRRRCHGQLPWQPTQLGIGDPNQAVGVAVVDHAGATGDSDARTASPATKLTGWRAVTLFAVACYRRRESPGRSC